MGKFAPSFIHDWFSEWHWKNCGNKAYLSDSDRLWHQINGEGKVIAIFDLKYPLDTISWTEECLIKFYEEEHPRHIPYYCIYIHRDSYKGTTFIVYRPLNKLFLKLSEQEMIVWIKNYRVNEQYFLSKAKPFPKEIQYIHEILEA